MANANSEWIVLVNEAHSNHANDANDTDAHCCDMC